MSSSFFSTSPLNSRGDDERHQPNPTSIMISTRALPHLWRHSARVTRSQPFRHGRWLSSGVSEPPILRRNLPGVKVRSSLTQRAPRLEPSEGVSSSEAKLDAGEVRADRESMTRRSTRQQQDDNALSDSPTSDLSSMDIFRSIPVPNVTIDACSNTGFVLTGNVPIENSGVFIACGEAFSWSPRECVSLSSEVLPSSQGTSKLELEKDSLGRWNIPLKALSLLEVLWPKPGRFGLAFFGNQENRSRIKG